MDMILIGAVVLGLVEAIKIATNIASRYIPIVTLLVTGILVALFVLLTKSEISWEIVQNGLIIALSATGLWSGTKAVLGK
jgi:hypothetical protein